MTDAFTPQQTIELVKRAESDGDLAFLAMQGLAADADLHRGGERVGQQFLDALQVT